ncbi:DJ-1/PfpI family protein [Ascidiimonas sp. W6]|uniref:DJ-1/PfpI family protein n=1 Tax=Ascidiimonas meishanensis TaxID=3128903 RepID=UPI0030EF15B8
MKLNVAIFIFEEAEVLDFAGPFEVFAVASELYDHTLFNVFTLAKTKDPIRAVNGLSVNPDHTFETAPEIHILIVAGGNGTNALIKDKALMDKVKKVHASTKYTASICSGSRVLAVIGVLEGMPYCTHHQVYDDMATLVPSGSPQKSMRYTGSGKIYTSGGISAGIDLSFHLVEKIYGKEVVQQTANYMEYGLN